MIRFILIACLICLLLVVMQKLRQLGQDRRKHHRQKQSVTRKQMIQCVYCSVYVPKGDASRKGDHYFCCDDHMEAEQKKI
jgi:uncharacterized protein